MSVPSFDLTSEPWLMVRENDGTIQELSLRDTLARAHDIREIRGDVPSEVFALTRLLLAVLYRALPEVTDPIADWKTLWREPALPMALIDDYLDDHRDRFDLIHPETPFYQVADLRTAKGETSGLEKLIADVPNGLPYLTTRRGAGLESIGLAEAARWLVHAHAFDPSGIKSGALGDDRVKGGKGYPIGTGWAGELGGLVVEGRTLRETLLLNLVLGDGDGRPFTEDDLATWERDPQTASIKGEEDRTPAGPADLFTWQSRRIRLVHNNDRVTGVLIANGNPLKPQNRFREETMTAWRRSEAQEKKLKQGSVFMPLTHNPERSMWRGLAAILPKSISVQEKQLMPASNLDWLRRLAAEEDDPIDDRAVRVHAYGIRYGTQSSTVDEIIDDVLTLQYRLIASTDTALAARAEDAVRATERAVDALGQLAGNLALAAGGEAPGPRDRAREQAYFALEFEFRHWLTRFGAGIADPDADVAAWFERAKRIILAQGAELIAAAGSVAWIGREVKPVGLVNSSKASVWFHAGVRKALASSEQQTEGLTA
ncbi:type I-E CRISPR-associated protein Cse1/CasA [Okibacterium endophyticum]